MGLSILKYGWLTWDFLHPLDDSAPLWWQVVLMVGGAVAVILTVIAIIMGVVGHQLAGDMYTQRVTMEMHDLETGIPYTHILLSTYSYSLLTKCRTLTVRWIQCVLYLEYVHKPAYIHDYGNLVYQARPSCFTEGWKDNILSSSLIAIILYVVEYGTILGRAYVCFGNNHLISTKSCVSPAHLPVETNPKVKIIKYYIPKMTIRHWENKT